MSTLQPPQKRYLLDYIAADLMKKMVFLGGPRQVGKTTFAKSLLQDEDSPAYLSWDSLTDRENILAGKLPRLKLIVFDEIHKFTKWRSLVKGFFDKWNKNHQFLITGSARLDHYRKSGDSLLGRYNYYRMHPLSLTEALSFAPKQNADIVLQKLLHFGGFPEPYFAQDPITLKRWHRGRREKLVYQDIRDLENVKEISNIEILMNALPDRIGAPLSRKNLAQDLEVDFKTVEHWITILESVYYCFRISPYGAPKIKAVKKEQKLYLWDWSELTDSGAVWENLVASHLLKFCHFIEDTQGEAMELRFLRDTLGREVDFVVLKNKKPLFAVECKTGEKKVSKHLSYFADRTQIPHFYQVHLGKESYEVSDKISLLPFAEFCERTHLK